jgi:hypothetical protein
LFIRGQEYLEIRIKLVISRYIFRKWLQNLIRMQLCFWNLHQFMFSNLFLLFQKEIHFVSGNFVGKFPKLIQSSKFHLIGSNSIHSFFFKLWAHSAVAQRIPLSTWFYTWKWAVAAFWEGPLKKLV